MFRYSAQWSLRHPKDGQLQADSEHQLSDSTDAFTKANAFIDRSIAEYSTSPYTLDRKQLSAGYVGLAERNWVSSSVFTKESYSRLVEHMQEWHGDGKRSLTLRAVATMRDITMDDVAAAGAEANTSRVRNAPTAAALKRVAVTLGVRNTATNRALAVLGTEQGALQAAGN